MSSYVYIKSVSDVNGNSLFTVGHYAPDGRWIPESDHATSDQAAERTAWLNGERHPLPDSIQHALDSGDGVYRP